MASQGGGVVNQGEVIDQQGGLKRDDAAGAGFGTAKKKKTRRKRAKVGFAAAAEGSARQALEALLPHGLGGDSEKSNKENGGVPTDKKRDAESWEPEPKKRKRKQSKRKALDASGKRLLERLKNQGLTLDRPTLKSEYWRAIPGSEEIWKPPEGDVYVEELLKFRQKNGRVSVIRLNAAQAEYSRRCGKLNIVLKARQLGITSYIAARYFVRTIMRPGTLTMLVAHDRIAAEEIFRIVRRFWDNMGEDYRKGPLRASHSSARELVFPKLDSEFTVASADENAGRGRTIQNLHCTEVSRWGHDGEEALASLRAAVVPGGEIVLESTANGAWGPFYEEWQQAPETGYVQHFFPWWIEESYKCDAGRDFTMTEEEAEVAAKNHLSAAQIAWRRRQQSSLRGLAVQEFAEDAVTCFKASGECVFGVEVIEKALAGAGQPIATEDNGRICYWLPPQAKAEYLIGVDPAGGLASGDYSCAQVIDKTTGAQCAELHGHFNPRETAELVEKLAKKYNEALVAVERNNHGHAVLSHLVDSRGYLNVYSEGGQQGWNTTAVSRPPMLANLTEMLQEKPDLFQSARLWNECKTFVRTAHGSPAAAPGAHDDCVLAMAIAQAVRKEGR